MTEKLVDSNVPYRPFSPSIKVEGGKIRWQCWVGTVRADMTCFRLHMSRAAAIKCAARWTTKNPHKPMHYELSDEEIREHLIDLFIVKDATVVKGRLRPVTPLAA